MPDFFATVLDTNYVPRALALFRSFRRHCTDRNKFGFFCLEDEAADLLERLDTDAAYVVRPESFLDSSMRHLREQRNPAEFAWTCKTAALLWAMDHVPEVDWVVTLDGDMAVFADLDLSEAGKADILLTPHRWGSASFAAFEPMVGSMNGGCYGFRNTANGRDAARWQLDRCVVDGCPSVPTPTAYGDQLYLDDLPRHFTGVHVSTQKGLNTAPWNIQSYRFSERDGAVWVDDELLRLYHFQGLKVHGARLFELYAGDMKLPAELVRLVYRPHLSDLHAAVTDVAALAGRILGVQRPGLRLMASKLKRLLRGQNNIAIC